MTAAEIQSWNTNRISFNSCSKLHTIAPLLSLIFRSIRSLTLRISPRRRRRRVLAFATNILFFSGSHASMCVCVHFELVPEFVIDCTASCSAHVWQMCANTQKTQQQHCKPAHGFAASRATDEIKKKTKLHVSFIRSWKQNETLTAHNSPVSLEQSAHFIGYQLYVLVYTSFVVHLSQHHVRATAKTKYINLF